MTIVNSFYEYKDELELIQAQNPVEHDLYSVISKVLKDNVQKGEISLRNFSETRQAEFSRSFRGESGFPDFLILTTEKSNKAELLGGIEIKRIITNLDLKTPRDEKQFSDHNKFYRKLIYTNGLNWKYYDADNLEMNWEVEIGTFGSKGFKWNIREWKNLLEKLQELKFTI